MIGQNHIGIGEGRRRGSLWKSRVLAKVHVERPARLRYGALTVFSKSLLLLMHNDKRKQTRRILSGRASKVFS